MIAEEVDRIVFRLTAAWPRPPIALETLAVWNEHLRPLRFVTAWDAVMLLERTKARQPSLSEFHEAYRASIPTSEQMLALEGPDDSIDDAAAKEYVGRVLERLRASSADEFQRRMPTRRGAVKFLDGSPARRTGTKTSSSRDFSALRYDQVYDENGKPK